MKYFQYSYSIIYEICFGCLAGILLAELGPIGGSVHRYGIRRRKILKYITKWADIKIDFKFFQFDDAFLYTKRIERRIQYRISLQGLLVFCCAQILGEVGGKGVFFYALSDGPNCFPVLFMTNLCWTAHQNQAVCVDQPLDGKDYEHFRAKVAFNISRMFESRMKGIAQHNNFLGGNSFHFSENGISWPLCQQWPCPLHCTD